VDSRAVITLRAARDVKTSVSKDSRPNRAVARIAVEIRAETSSSRQ